MNDYSLTLFLHIVGVLGYFISLALEWVYLWQVRRGATPEEVDKWLRTSGNMRRASILSMLTLLVSGIYMMATVWGGIAWIFVSLGSLVLLILLATVGTGWQQGLIHRALSTGNREQQRFPDELIHRPALWISIQVRVTIALGIVFLMTVKPGLTGSLLTIAIAAVLGLVSALATRSRGGGMQDVSPVHSPAP